MRSLTDAELDEVSGGAKGGGGGGAYQDLLIAISNIPINGSTMGALARMLPEFPNSKPGTWQAKFNAWEDNYETMIPAMYS